MKPLSDKVRNNLIQTAKDLKGAKRRLFMARTVLSFGLGGQRFAESEFGWSRVTIRKGVHELRSNITCHDHFGLRGRKRAEVHLPNLLVDLRSICLAHSQTEPRFRTQRLYTRLTASEVRTQLIKSKGYSAKQVPTVRTIVNKLNALGFKLKQVEKTLPKKRPR